MSDVNRPIFVGGTGRSGTSIMGRFLDSHADLALPVHENKLIVEDGGLRSLIHQLSEGFDYKANSAAIIKFEWWADVLRQRGFRKNAQKRMFRYTNRFRKLLNMMPLSAEDFCRRFPTAEYTLHSIGDKFGVEHYDQRVKEFTQAICASRDLQGVFDTEGIVRPIVEASTNSNKDLLQIARTFLNSLYSPHLQDSGAARWCDDTPLNVQYASFLLELYPDARIIHMVRDPRDVFASYMKQSWVSKNEVLTLTRLSKQYFELICSERRVSSSKMMRVNLEALVKDRQSVVRKLSEFLEIRDTDFNESIKFEASSLGRWRKELSQRQVREIERRLDFALEYFEYK